jgi:hypothetical protein
MCRLISVCSRRRCHTAADAPWFAPGGSQSRSQRPSAVVRSPLSPPICGRSTKRFSLIRLLLCSLLCSALMTGVLDVRAALAASRQTPIEALHVPELDAGFHLLYELEPEKARNQFETWHESNPEDPLGSAPVAASYLFEECIQQGVLTSEFFLDNKRFLSKIPLKPDPTLRAAFFAADKQAQDLAQQRLRTNPGDANALFAMTLSLGIPAERASAFTSASTYNVNMIIGTEDIRSLSTRAASRPFMTGMERSRIIKSGCSC